MDKIDTLISSFFDEYFLTKRHLSCEQKKKIRKLLYPIKYGHTDITLDEYQLINYHESAHTSIIYKYKDYVLRYDVYNTITDAHNGFIEDEWKSTPYYHYFGAPYVIRIYLYQRNGVRFSIPEDIFQSLDLHYMNANEKHFIGFITFNKMQGGFYLSCMQSDLCQRYSKLLKTHQKCYYRKDAQLAEKQDNSEFVEKYNCCMNQLNHLSRKWIPMFYGVVKDYCERNNITKIAMPKTPYVAGSRNYLLYNIYKKPIAQISEQTIQCDETTLYNEFVVVKAKDLFL